MGQLTLQERRRVFLARQQMNRQILGRASRPMAASEPALPPRPRSQVVKMVLIAALLSACWFVTQQVELHVPTSILDALPRL